MGMVRPYWCGGHVAIKTYDGYSGENWMKGLSDNDKYNQRHLMALFAFLGVPDSFADFGCGTGAMVKTAQMLGVKAYGVDQLVDENWPKGFYHANLVDSFVLPDGPVDVLLSCEIGEHLDSSAHATFCDTLCDNLKSGGGKYLIFSAARPGQGGTGHVACVVEGTKVKASGIRFVTRRSYQGEVVTIVTRNGNNLTVTPNHPILTERGWVAAGLLNEGCNILCGDFAERESINVVPNDYERPIEIEKIFSSFLKLQESSLLSVPLSAEDFHGDGIPNSNVEIVSTNGFGKNAVVPALRKPLEHLSVQDGCFLSAILNGLGACFSARGTHHSSSIDSSRTLGPTSPFLWGHFFGRQFHPLESVSNPNALFFQKSGNASIANPIGVSDFERRFSGKIPVLDIKNIKSSSRHFPHSPYPNSVTDEDTFGLPEINVGLDRQFSEGFSGEITSEKIVVINRSYFNGHVYNLHTEQGWYNANGIITHNCRPAEYWHNEFLIRKMSYNDWMTMSIAHVFSRINTPLNYLWDNLMVFEK